MSRLENALASSRFVVTAELLTVDSGGLDAVRNHFAPYEDWVDAVNATDNTSAHAHASPLAIAIALKQLGMERRLSGSPTTRPGSRRRRRSGLSARARSSAPPPTTASPATTWSSTRWR